MTQVESTEKLRFTLKRTFLLSLLVKFSIFLVGVLIIGILTTRTDLPSCGSHVSTSLPSVFTSPIGDLEGYTDFRDLYLRCLVTPFLNGSPAYNLPIVYNYPPLFLYVLSASALINLIWTPAFTLVLFDALTVVPLYLIVKNFASKNNSKLAFAISLAWIANPINLFYNDLMWLNPGPTTFFLMLSIYFFLRGSYPLSSVALAISTGFKQTTVLIFPILLILFWKMHGFKKTLLYYAAIYIGLLAAISLPYIYQNPQQYFWALQLPILGNPPGTTSGTPTSFVYDLSQPVRLTTFLGLVKFLDLKSIAIESYSILNYVVIAIYAVMLLILILSKRKTTSNDLFIYCLTAFLIFDSFFGRGVYKYYFAVLTPLAIPFFSSKRGLIIFESFSVALLLVPRIVTPWMAILLITFLPSLIRKEPEIVEGLEG